MGNIITDISILDVVDHMKMVLDNATSEINAVIQQYQSSEKLNKVWLGDWEMISDYPCVTIEPGAITQKWGATSTTMENTYTAVVYCYVKNLNKEVSVKYITNFADAVRRVLTHPNNLAWTIPGKERAAIYDSFITSVQFGFKKGFVLRAAQMNYTAVGWNIQVDRA